MGKVRVSCVVGKRMDMYGEPQGDQAKTKFSSVNPVETGCSACVSFLRPAVRKSQKPAKKPGKSSTTGPETENMGGVKAESTSGMKAQHLELPSGRTDHPHGNGSRKGLEALDKVRSSSNCLHGKILKLSLKGRRAGQALQPIGVAQR